jgi:hypothetical protein
MGPPRRWRGENSRRPTRGNASIGLGPGLRRNRLCHRGGEGRGRQSAPHENGASVATGPVSGSGRGVSTPVGSQSGSAGASSNRARSGIIRASSEPSLRTWQGKPRFRPVDVFPASRRPSGGRPSGKPATFPGASFRQAGDLSADILPASRRLSVAALCPPGEPGLATVRSSRGEPFESLPVSLRASSPGGLSRFLRPKAIDPPDSGKVGSAWGFPAASRFFPAAPPERPWSPSRRISTLSALAAFRSFFPFPVGPS